MWALFNTALREIGREKGSMVQKRVGAEALTKQELQELCESRQDLVSNLAAWGAEIPTTSMHWRSEANHLQWIVRQMSWRPPWVEDRRRGTTVEKVYREKERRTKMAAIKLERGAILEHGGVESSAMQSAASGDHVEESVSTEHLKPEPCFKKEVSYPSCPPSS